jgi:dTDP-4-dehydrorhamnose 3,5-epimerase
MIFKETRLAGAFIVEPERFADERGFFARTWSQREFAERGLASLPVECNVSFNQRKGTLRGMHYQVAPQAQAKLVNCSRGAIYDVIVDLRPASPTFKKWIAVELTGLNGMLLYVPAGFAHGFQTLADETEVAYQMFEVFAPDCANGVRWNDPAFDINWPDAERVINERDQSYPDFRF